VAIPIKSELLINDISLIFIASNLQLSRSIALVSLYSQAPLKTQIINQKSASQPRYVSVFSPSPVINGFCGFSSNLHFLP